MQEKAVKKILILTLGTGPRFNDDINKEIGYHSTQYVINGKSYQKNGIDVETNFVAEPIIDFFEPDEIFMLGTVTSCWYQFYASAITTDNDDKSYLEDKNYKRLFDIKSKEGINTDSGDLKAYSGEITGIFQQIKTWKRYPRFSGNKKPGIHILLTKYGINEKELKENYSILKGIESFLEEGINYEVAFDITHSFRSLPIYNLIIFNYIRNITKYNLSICHVYYGMLEIKKENNEEAPIVDLIDIVNVLNLTNGVAEFKDTGNAISLLEMLDDNDSVKSILKDFDLATQLNAFDKIKDLLIELCRNIQGKADDERFTGIREMINIVLKNRFFEDDTFDINKLNELPDADLKFCLTKWFFNQNRMGLGLATGLEALRDMVTPAFMQARNYPPADERKYRENAESYFISLARRLEQRSGEKSELEHAVCNLGTKLRHYKDIRNIFAHSLSNPITHNLDDIKRDIDNFRRDFYTLKQIYDDAPQSFQALFTPVNTSSASHSAAGKECRVMLDCSGNCNYSNYQQSATKSYDVLYLNAEVQKKIFGGIAGKKSTSAERAYYLCEYLKRNLSPDYEKTNIVLTGFTNADIEFVFRLYLENLCNEHESWTLQRKAENGGINNYGKLNLILDSDKMKTEFAQKESDYASTMETPLSKCPDK